MQGIDIFDYNKIYMKGDRTIFDGRIWRFNPNIAQSQFSEGVLPSNVIRNGWYVWQEFVDEMDISVEPMQGYELRTFENCMQSLPLKDAHDGLAKQFDTSAHGHLLGGVD